MSLTDFELLANWQIVKDRRYLNGFKWGACEGELIAAP